jgi:Putative transposase/Transposase zinc-binding domain
MHLATGDGGQSLRVHELLRRWAPEYLERFGSSLPGRQRQILKKILSCRTPALGGQLFQCPGCSGFEYRYHSCNDRHCPLCGQTDADAWLNAQKARLLLPVPYFLLTFTVPEALRRLIRCHLEIGLNLLFELSAQALRDLAANPKRLGAQLGMLGVLHTWSRTLIFHPHIHYLIPGGGLSPDGRQWVPARKNFLLHHQALGDHFRTLVKERLTQKHPDLFAQVPADVWKVSWNVGCQAAGSGENALRYLSRYVFKTATSNRPVGLLPEGKLLWTYRESKTRQFTSLKLDPLEFLSRFLQHVLPPGFARVRTFGWLHPAAKVRLNRVRALLRLKPVLTPAEVQTWHPLAEPKPQAQTPSAEPVSKPEVACVPFCVRCQKAMRLISSWKPGQPVAIPKRPRRPP